MNNVRVSPNNPPKNSYVVSLPGFNALVPLRVVFLFYFFVFLSCFYSHCNNKQYTSKRPKKKGKNRSPTKTKRKRKTHQKQKQPAQVKHKYQNKTNKRKD